MRDVGARLLHDRLPPDVVVLSVTVTEGLSRLFDVTVDLASEDPDVDLAALLFTTGAVEILAEGDPPRAFHGVVEEALYLDEVEEHYYYRLRLRPSLHGLAYRTRTRIYQDLDVVEIVSQVLEGAGIASAAIEWRANGTYPKREYCTQWKESELDFVLRLLEDEGISFLFEHSPTDHVLCFVDPPSPYPPIDGDPVLSFAPRLDHPTGVAECVFGTRLTCDVHQTRDWNWKTPETPRQAEASLDGAYAQYEYPGGFLDDGDGARRAQARLDEQTHRRYELRAVSVCTRLAPGRRFTLTGALPSLLEDDFVPIELEHRFTKEPGESAAGVAGPRYRATMRCLRADFTFRPPRVTPKPRIHGMESAVVTGPAGEEIHVDEFGRIKVHFYWDREQAVDDKASCWLRVQQMNTTGSMILPRVGWEMHVAFRDGDPDRPLAFHKAYNLETMPPYGLPGAKTRSSLQTATTPGGGSTNEVRYEDSGGGQEFFLNASKDLSVHARNNTSETIGVDAEERVGADSTSLVSGNEAVTIGSNQSWSVAGNLALETTADKSVVIGATDDWGVTSQLSMTDGGDRTETIGALMNVLACSVAESVAGSHTRTVGGLQAIVSATAIVESVGGSKTETIGAAKIVATSKSVEETVAGLKTLNSGLVNVKTGKDVTMEAVGAFAVTSAGAIKVKCGADFAMSGTVVLVTAPGGITMKGGGGKFTLKGSTITVDAASFGGKGGPLLEIKGPINYTD